MSCIARSTFTVSAAFGGGKKKVTEVGNVKTSGTKKFANIGAAVQVRPSTPIPSRAAFFVSLNI